MTNPILIALQTPWPNILVMLERNIDFNDLHNLFMCTSVLAVRARDQAAFRIPIHTNLAVTQVELEHTREGANQAFLAYAFNNIFE